LSSKQIELTKNFFALGVMFWLYERSMAGTEKWIAEKFAGKDAIAEANRRALHAGYAFGETTEIFHTHYRVAAAHLPPGTYRNITGNEATALGFVMASKLAERDLFLASYPITPASDILHQLSSYKHLGIKTVQSEDEIAAIGAAVLAAEVSSDSKPGSSHCALMRRLKPSRYMNTTGGFTHFIEGLDPAG
ncbi:MAG: hypothetical protein EBW05_11425, partial [Betaproteobacteria bacterium]|nr:hypothetical protein [Betaproteobacteria bacterium]